MKAKSIGIIGGGQLGMMLTQSAHKLGLVVNILEKTKDCPAFTALKSNDKFILGELSDYEKLLELASVSDVLTFEIEHINTEVLFKLEAETGKHILPSPQILDIINDKFIQKTFLKKAGLPVGKFEPIRSLKNFDKLIRQFGFPFLIKSRKGGYDGGGNFVIRSNKDLKLITLKLNLFNSHEQYFVEKFVPFEREISVLLARSISGEVSCYPIIDTFQEDGACSKTLVPSSSSLEIKEKAKIMALDIITKLANVGLMAVEMFVLDSGEILINEIAPRVHNSGHWTLDGSVTSQFEQHIRCVAGIDLGSVEDKFPATLMYNIFGYNFAILDKMKKNQQQNISIYNYNKKELRQNRKMGHVNIVGETAELINRELEAILSL
jgi:phosphoribosylaminoimidazole carboxylase PurK protein